LLFGDLTVKTCRLSDVDQPVVAPSVICSAPSFSRNLSFHLKLVSLRFWQQPTTNSSNDCPPWRSMCRTPSSLDLSIGNNWWLASAWTPPWKDVRCQDQTFSQRECFSRGHDQQCHPTSSCRVDPTWQGNDGQFECHLWQSQCNPLPPPRHANRTSQQWHLQRSHPMQKGHHHHCQSHGSQPPWFLDRGERSPLLDLAVPSQAQPCHFYAGSAPACEAMGSLASKWMPALHPFRLFDLLSLISDPIWLQKRSCFGFYLSFCIHISQANFEGVPWCIFILSFLLFIWFWSYLQGAAQPYPTGNGDTAHRVSFKVSFEKVLGYRWPQFTLTMLIFELIMMCHAIHSLDVP